MITYEKALELIEFQKQQIADLTAERDRLKGESANASEALSASNKNNAAISESYNDAVEALAMLGVTEEEENVEG